MEFRQFYLGCLAQASYLVGSKGECAIVDPRRDVGVYLDAARELGLSIRFVIETHLHADFVSGHRELAEATGADIVFGRKAGVAYPHCAVADGDELRLGDLVLRVLETPGHTPESICVVVIENETPRGVFTGDTLFVGDVGRPDLVAAVGLTPADMAATLHDSLWSKLMPLPDATEVWPGHGAGSLCGKNLSSERTSTIGHQRATNHALQPMSREAFVTMMTAELPDQPRYFAMDARLNRQGPSALADLADPAPLSPDALAAHQLAGATVLDVRPAADYGAGHVAGAINIGLGGQFASWAGTLLPLDAPIVLVAANADEVAEARMRLARVGLENVTGVLDGGMGAWIAAGRPVATTPQVSVDELARLLAAGDDIAVLDVRRPGELAAGRVPVARHVSLAELERAGTGLDPSRPVAIICGSGYRSSAAVGILERNRFLDIRNVAGGTTAWLAAGHPATRG